MKSKKLLVMVLVLLAGISLFAQSTEIQLYNDYVTYRTMQRVGGTWGAPAWKPGMGVEDIITLKVKAGDTVYLTNYVGNFDQGEGSQIPNLGDENYGAGFNMEANHYGYVVVDKGANGNLLLDGSLNGHSDGYLDGYGIYKSSVDPETDIVWGTGETTKVTYYSADGSYSQTTTGYLLDTFTKDAEIFIVMTPNGYDQTVDSYNYVDDPLQSRQLNTVDQVENGRFNFGTVDGVGHEFVIGYVASNTPPPSGQPLPGVLTSCLIGLAATSIAARRRKHSRK
ncbi:MAG: hypothetical protein IKZ46_12560 [Victivallales bacterium]|nr:hypothetical protein [Victivallales bacterium]